MRFAELLAFLAALCAAAWGLGWAVGTMPATELTGSMVLAQVLRLLLLMGVFFVLCLLHRRGVKGLYTKMQVLLYAYLVADLLSLTHLPVTMVSAGGVVVWVVALDVLVAGFTSFRIRWPAALSACVEIFWIIVMALGSKAVATLSFAGSARGEALIHVTLLAVIMLMAGPEAWQDLRRVVQGGSERAAKGKRGAVREGAQKKADQIDEPADAKEAAGQHVQHS